MVAEPPPATGPIGVYLHFPFCAARCTYCDFPTVVGRDDRIASYLTTLEREILEGRPSLPARADTVYLGGGTPSRMTPDQLAGLLAVVRRRFDLTRGAEVTIECNPEGIDEAKLAAYREAGVTRVSIGVQSLVESVLRSAGRTHDAACAREAVRSACRTAGLEVNADLIVGLPGEPLARWSETIREVAGMGTDHVSVYLLETDKASPLASALREGRTTVADDDRLAAAYGESVRILEGAGLQLYEISNLGRDGSVSRHNLKYWTDAWYAGFGLGAHGYDHGRRRANRSDLDGYLRDVGAGRDPLAWQDDWDARRRLDEAVILGLRIVDGVDLDALGRRYGVDMRRLYAPAWRRGEEAGLVELHGPAARLTERGRVLSNELFTELIAA
jgi:oxygen-independent coproporphyrinogen-3 oxidase